MSDGRPTNRRRWSLTQEALEALLTRLSADREQAGAKFESLRHKLLQYFAYESCGLPDKWADETLDRVAKRLSEGSQIDDISIFTRGVARMVLREARLAATRERKLSAMPEPSSRQSELDPVDHATRDAACLETCIASLPAAARELVQEYYLGTAASNATARRAFAARLGIQMDALRSRALRVRRQLETCLRECREKHDPSAINQQNSSSKSRSQR